MKKICFNKKYGYVLMLLVAWLGTPTAFAQSPWDALAAKPSTLGLDSGLMAFNTPDFQLKLVKASQTVAALNPNSENKFDFTPGERLELRSKDGMYHLGDITFKVRSGGTTDWKSYSTAAKRGTVTAIAATAPVLAAADLTGTLPQDAPLLVQRYWEVRDHHLVLRFVLQNKTQQALEIGALGIPMVFNNIMEGKSLEEAHAGNVFYDPYIGKDAGYLQVTRLSGHGPVLLVVPYKNASLEAYNPLLDDPTPRGITFEGFHEWTIYSRAYADKEWKDAEPWNTPTSSYMLKPGEVREYALQFLLASSVKSIERKLAESNRPVAIGVPGYILPQDVNAQLFLSYKEKVKSIQVEPQRALTLQPKGKAANGYAIYEVKGNQWGRARLSITYNDGLCQTISYKVIKAEKEVVKDYGRFLTQKQWFNDKSDPFGRSPSVISYDYEKGEQVTQDSRAWIAGLSDEGGAGGWLGAMMKELLQPDKQEVSRLQQFVNNTLWGKLQHSEGKEKYGVKKSLFYYQPDEMPAGTYNTAINYKTWAAWSHKDANDVGRSYNYPHVAAAHWALYRLARNHTGLVTEQNWQWYLDKAYNTSMAMVKLAPYYAQFGQMEGTVFYLILMDLKAEGWFTLANQLENAMKARANHWRTLQYPFGSEMPWDSTGQEEVYLWSKYFGYGDKAAVTMNAILAYMPTVPHWGYNGSARRYWDFLYGGKLQRVERQLHHYGSGLNAIPVLSEYRNHPEDTYLLRVGYGGTLGAISNITQDGFGSAAFHSFPSTLKIDGLSGDYGSNFFGYAVNTATYLTHDKELGWLAFGGNLELNGSWVKVNVTTAAQSQLYIAPLGLWLTLDAGTFKSASYNTKTRQLQISLNAADAYTPVAYLHIQQPTALTGGKKYGLTKSFSQQRGAFAIPLKKTITQLTLAERK
ncbi:hypothetical protein KHS38_20365 [Mucilaginibacter sp. Bleaf8]|uniref:DUF5695 domain-containing protein n=1 Tax=Mucilaginibacter sp. Bleaf8 TaxID=2834430 RepID=UPI001BCE472C|nr:DUF5695 domain-containing protein [Mucilaginibacter sp. Bleaf8]MBS7566771.1 hypothetical protein [Mucilaginibacter sp. Bleaf8]